MRGPPNRRQRDGASTARRRSSSQNCLTRPGASAFIYNVNVLDLIGLKNELGDSFINDAAVTVTIKDADGAIVAAMPMTYVAASAGTYRALLSPALPLQAKVQYLTEIDADGGAFQFGHFEFYFKPLARIVEDE